MRVQPIVMCAVLLAAPCLQPCIRAQRSTNCTLHKGLYTCNWTEAQQVLAGSRTVHLPVDPMDRFTAVQLRRLTASLGKTVTPHDQRADLEMDVVPGVSTGVTIGSADRSLATLRIFDLRGDAERPKLVWAETFRGQPDRPWASEVQAAIAQFQARLAKR